MAISFILIGALLTVAAVKNQQSLLFSTFIGDVEGGYIYWALAVVAVGLVGYIPSLAGLSTALLALIFVVLLLSHTGFFSKLEAQFGITPKSSKG